MGYTHYFNFKKATKGQAKLIEEKYQRAILDCQRVIKAYSRDHGGLSGYTAHTALGQYSGLQVNGADDLRLEEFSLREHFSQNDSGFCKTGELPYDIVVVACLAILKHRLGDCFEVSSDGTTSDWEAGVTLARTITGLKIKNPIGGRVNFDVSL